MLVPGSGWSPTPAVAADGFVDPYLDPDTGILRNLVGARTLRDLDAAESALAHGRGLELLEPGIVRPTGDLDEFRAIHQFCAGES